ncbi:phosphopeptide-binding protein [Cellulomonas sp. Root485]|uniref:FHA domain-containing protein n=1 Tax=Cellulomonas sp. Root485 TaxID=1736546 RepID=UPI00070141B3|nr:FHA domain-containing protein [Cellulomonas sp. Root485]KQY24069.1 phosphopeptide-binding protein [Cellulomonas sp. Root485]
MSTVTCPNGHPSTSTDYCDVCGSPIEAAVTVEAPVAPAAGTATTCPHCGAPASSLALFCEVCGYDFTTGTAPAPIATPIARPAPATPPAGSVESDPVSAPVPVATPAPQSGSDPGSAAVAGSSGAALPTPAPAGEDSWVAEIWVDPDWYAVQKAEDPMPSAGLPGLVPLRERSVLVGRPSASRNIHPAVDCGTDSGVSRRHCQLNTDGQRWWVEDLQSANGTYVSRAGDPLPTTPIPAGQRREIEDGDRLYIGAWTRIVIRTALPGEV